MNTLKLSDFQTVSVDSIGANMMMNEIPYALREQIDSHMNSTLSSVFSKPTSVGDLAGLEALVHNDDEDIFPAQLNGLELVEEEVRGMDGTYLGDVYKGVFGDGVKFTAFHWDFTGMLFFVKKQ